MGREIDDDVDIVLVQPEVEPGTVEVIQLAELLSADEFSELPDRRVVLGCVHPP